MREPFPTTPADGPFALPLAIGIVGLVLLAGCGASDAAPPVGDEPDGAESALVNEGFDIGDVETRAASVSAISTFAALNFEDASLAAAAASRGTKNFFVPAGCVTSAVTGESTVVHTLDQCNGPWGLRRISGAITVAYAVTSLEGAPALALDLTTQGLRIAQATVDFRAHAVLSGKTAERRMTYDAELEGTTAQGRTFARSVDWRESWKVGESCLTIDGVSEGTVGSRSLRTTAENFQRCRNACPTAGGSVTLEDTTTGASVSVRFDGESGATVTGTEGRSYALTLPCAGE